MKKLTAEQIQDNWKKLIDAIEGFISDDRKPQLLKMYEDLSCIKRYEKRTVFSLWGVDVDMSWLKKSFPVESKINKE